LQQKYQQNLKIRFSNNIVFKIPVIRSRPDVYSTLVAVIQNEIKSGIEEKKSGTTTALPENPTCEIGKVEDEQDGEDDDEEDCLRIIEETMVDPKSLPGRKKYITNSIILKIESTNCLSVSINHCKMVYLIRVRK